MTAPAPEQWNRELEGHIREALRTGRFATLVVNLSPADSAGILLT